MTNEADRRAMILAAAQKLFEAHGLQKTTVAGIAREAHVAVGSVYLEFSSKTLILQELSRSKFRDVLRAMRRAAMGSGSFADRLQAIMNARANAFMQIACCHEHGNELLQSGCEGVAQAREAFVREQRDLLSDFLMSAQDSGEFAPIVDIDLTVQSLLLAYAPFTPPQLMSLPREHLPRALKGMHALVLSGLEARP